MAQRGALVSLRPGRQGDEWWSQEAVCYQYFFHVTLLGLRSSVTAKAGPRTARTRRRCFSMRRCRQALGPTIRCAAFSGSHIHPPYSSSASVICVTKIKSFATIVTTKPNTKIIRFDGTAERSLALRSMMPTGWSFCCSEISTLLKASVVAPHTHDWIRIGTGIILWVNLCDHNNPPILKSFFLFNIFGDNHIHKPDYRTRGFFSKLWVSATLDHIFSPLINSFSPTAYIFSSINQYFFHKSRNIFCSHPVFYSIAHCSIAPLHPYFHTITFINLTNSQDVFFILLVSATLMIFFPLKSIFFPCLHFSVN